MVITQVVHSITGLYPWTHRIAFNDHIGDWWPVYEWTEDEGIPGVWVNGVFYTTGEYITIVALKWGHL